ncbi:MAG: PLP-dependent transferase [Cloacibacillus evryensis]
MTKALHSGWSCDSATGAAGLPIYASSAFQFRDSARRGALQPRRAVIYSRLANPTVQAFEAGLNALEGGVGTLGHLFRAGGLCPPDHRALLLQHEPRRLARSTEAR